MRPRCSRHSSGTGPRESGDGDRQAVLRPFGTGVALLTRSRGCDRLQRSLPLATTRRPAFGARRQLNGGKRIVGPRFNGPAFQGLRLVADSEAQALTGSRVRYGSGVRLFSTNNSIRLSGFCELSPSRGRTRTDSPAIGSVLRPPPFDYSTGSGIAPPSGARGPPIVSRTRRAGSSGSSLSRKSSTSATNRRH